MVQLTVLSTLLYDVILLTVL